MPNETDKYWGDGSSTDEERPKASASNKQDSATGVDKYWGASGDENKPKEEPKALPVGEVRNAPSAWKSFKGAVSHPIDYLSDVESDVTEGGGRTIAGRALGHFQHGSMEDTGFETKAGTTPAVASIIAGPLQGPPKVVRGALRMAEDVKNKTFHPIASEESLQAGEPNEFVSGLNEVTSGAMQTAGPLVYTSPTALPRIVAGSIASKAAQKGLGVIGAPEEYQELGGNIAGGLAAGAPEAGEAAWEKVSESPTGQAAIRTLARGKRLAGKVPLAVGTAALAHLIPEAGPFIEGAAALASTFVPGLKVTPSPYERFGLPAKDYISETIAREMEAAGQPIPENTVVVKKPKISTEVRKLLGLPEEGEDPRGTGVDETEVTRKYEEARENPRASVKEIQDARRALKSERIRLSNPLPEDETPIDQELEDLQWADNRARMREGGKDVTLGPRLTRQAEGVSEPDLVGNEYKEEFPKSADDYHPAVREQVFNLRNAKLKQLAEAHGLDPDAEGYKFGKGVKRTEETKTSSGRIQLGREKLIDDIMAQMGDDEKANIGRGAEALEHNPDMAGKAKAERAESLFPRIRPQTIPKENLEVGDTFVDETGEPRRVTGIEGDKIRTADGTLRTYDSEVKAQGELNSPKARLAQGGKLHPIGEPEPSKEMKTPKGTSTIHPSSFSADRSAFPSDISEKGAQGYIQKPVEPLSSTFDPEKAKQLAASGDAQAYSDYLAAHSETSEGGAGAAARHAKVFDEVRRINQWPEIGPRVENTVKGVGKDVRTIPGPVKETEGLRVTSDPRIVPLTDRQGNPIPLGTHDMPWAMSQGVSDAEDAAFLQREAEHILRGGPKVTAEPIPSPEDVLARMYSPTDIADPKGRFYKTIEGKLHEKGVYGADAEDLSQDVVADFLRKNQFDVDNPLGANDAVIKKDLKTRAERAAFDFHMTPDNGVVELDSKDNKLYWDTAAKEKTTARMRMDPDTGDMVENRLVKRPAEMERIDKPLSSKSVKGKLKVKHPKMDFSETGEENVAPETGEIKKPEWESSLDTEHLKKEAAHARPISEEDVSHKILDNYLADHPKDAKFVQDAVDLSPGKRWKIDPRTKDRFFGLSESKLEQLADRNDITLKAAKTRLENIGFSLRYDRVWGGEFKSSSWPSGPETSNYMSPGNPGEYEQPRYNFWPDMDESILPRSNGPQTYLWDKTKSTPFYDAETGAFRHNTPSPHAEETPRNAGQLYDMQRSLTNSLGQVGRPELLNDRIMQDTITPRVIEEGDREGEEVFGHKPNKYGEGNDRLHAPSVGQTLRSQVWDQATRDITAGIERHIPSDTEIHINSDAKVKAALESAKSLYEEATARAEDDSLQNPLLKSNARRAFDSIKYITEHSEELIRTEVERQTRIRDSYVLASDIYKMLRERFPKSASLTDPFESPKSQWTAEHRPWVKYPSVRPKE